MEEQTSERMRKQLAKLREQHNEAIQHIDGEGASLKDALKNVRSEIVAKEKMLLHILIKYWTFLLRLLPM